ncbi:short chain dehydrogenase/reductase [Lepidopterella palustris CBS 459.81]|uniref:Short chain dehydrogenase/reductase n=1 Tax=Lepidopterella palustris CBS 459.81 TaxID=1314670 RepID=A0A8E2DWH3_9PEZI|nr:short chain dehydrogenase/reductase [Lepidopterella palustris CBS 459.81]
MTVFHANATALITGGASGIGFAVAQLCRFHGMRVALVDRNADTLAAAAKELSSPENVSTHNVDVSQAAQWTTLKADVEKKFGAVDFFMLNAGVGVRGTWGEPEYFQKVMDTNLFGVINGLNAFVPTFTARSGDNPSAIVITGSKQGITNPPGNAAYNASKAAVKVLAEHLSWDLRNTKTSVHLLVPGWTFTSLGGGGPGWTGPKPAGAWAPEQVAEYMYKKMSEGKFYIICPDNDVTEEMDKKRMLWTAGDVVNERPPLTRWRPEFKEEVEKWMNEQKL